MSAETHEINVSGMQILVVRKAIKHLNLRVYPPHGRVRVAAPLRVSDEAVRLAVVGKLVFCKKELQYKAIFAILCGHGAS